MQETHIFNYQFLKTIRLPMETMTYMSDIARYQESLNYKREMYPELLKKLEDVSLYKSSKASNAIEGIFAPDLRIYQNINGDKPQNDDEAAIKGYYQVLNRIHHDSHSFKFEEDLPLLIHRDMLILTPFEKGVYKTENNVIAKTYFDGHREIVWKPTDSDSVSRAMNQLYLAFLDAFNDYDINNLLLIPCVILDFLCIHPFIDGNGRASRLLTLLLLYRSGYSGPKYISLEDKIYRSRNLYYDDLAASSKGWHENENDYVPFINNFLFTLSCCYRDLYCRLVVDSHYQKLSKTERIIYYINENLAPVSKNDIHNYFPDISYKLLDVTLTKLVKEGKIEKIGQGIKTRYQQISKN